MAVTGWQVRAYFNNVHLKAQESRAKAEGTTQEKTQRSRMIGFPVLDVAEGETPTSRLAPTPDNTPGRTMRWCYPTPWRINMLEDEIDELESFWEVNSPYVMSAAASRNRTGMSRLLTAAVGAAAESAEDTAGTAFTSVAFDTTNQQIPHGSAGATKQKIVHARTILDDAVGGDVEVMGPYYLAYAPADIRFLLNDAELNSLDSVSRQQLMDGKPVQGLLGYNWIPTSQCPLSGTVRSWVAWAKMGMGRGNNRAGMKMRAGERADLSYAFQIFRSDKFGYVRIDDKMVVEILIDTTQTP